MKKNIFLLSLAILLTSCNLISFDEYKLTMTPGSELSWFNGNYITLDFNCNVRKYYIESSYSLKKDDSICDIDFYWISDSQVNIIPREGWTCGSLYIGKISGSLYTSDGNNFSVFDICSFYYGDKANKFTLIEAPFYKKSLDKKDELIFKFNHSVNRAEFETSISITPSLNYVVQIDPEFKEYKIIPTTNWEVNKTYKWSFKTLKSNDNWKLSGKTEGEFHTLEDSKIPELLTICPVTKVGIDAIWLTTDTLDNNIALKMPIGLIFSKPIDLASIKSGISITPSISTYIIPANEDNTKFLIIPEENYSIDIQYLIKVDQTIKDTNGIALLNEHKEIFRSSERYLEISKIKFDNDVTLDSINNIPACIDKTISTDTNGIKEISISIAFSLPIDEKKIKSVEESITFSLIFPLSSTTPIKTACSWDESRKIVSLTWKNITTSTIDVESFYMLKIPGGKNSINTGRGNYMKEDVCVYLKLL